MHSPRELANCGKLHMASVLDGLEFKPHLGGHGDKAHYSRGVLYGAKALTSNRVLPHCERRTDVTGSEAVENKVSTTLRAHAAPHRGGFSVGL